MPGFFTDGELASDPGSIFDYDVTAGEAFGSGFGRQFDTNPLALVARQARYLNDDLQNLAGGGVDWVDAEKAAGEVQSRGLDLKIPKGGIARHELDMLQYLKQREIEQNTTSARTRGVGPTAAGFAGGLAASLTDPINVASGFIPIVNQVRYAQWLARAGEGVFARAAVRAGAGAIEGAVGAAIIEPIVYAGATSEQLDYGLMDSFLNVTLGGVLGGGLHVIGGAVYDRAGRGAGAPDVEAALRDAAANMPEATQREMFQSAVAAIERGEPVDVTPVVAKQVDAAREERIAGFAAKRGDVVFSGRTQEDLIDAIAAATGEPVKTVEASLDLAKEGFITTSGRYLSREEAAKIGAAPDRRVPLVDPSVAGAVAPGERVVSAAIKVGKKIYAGTTHADAMEALRKATGKTEAQIDAMFNDGKIDVDGFLTNTGRHVTRAEAGRIASARKQFKSGAQGSFEKPLPDALDIDFNADAARGLSDLIPEARADRTQEAFNRQFVDKADEVIAAEKARPKDRIESVKQDEADFTDMVEEYRGQGRVTAEDDASLKQADELAAWAERRAKAFEAAAGCIEAA